MKIRIKHSDRDEYDYDFENIKIVNDDGTEELLSDAFKTLWQAGEVMAVFFERLSTLERCVVTLQDLRITELNKEIQE
jgi:hypothetical protein